MNNDYNGAANAQNNQQPQTQQQAQHSQEAKRQPENTLRDGSIKATIWGHEGKHGEYYTTDFAKTYRDKQGNLKDGKSFASNELLRLAELARQAHHDVSERRRAAFQRHQEAVRAGLVPARGNSAPEYDR